MTRLAANQALHTMTAASVVLAKSGVIGAAVMCELGRWAHRDRPHRIIEN